jgi:hypothetical protein
VTGPQPPTEFSSVINVFLDRVYAEGGNFGFGTRGRPRRETGTLDDRDIAAAIGRHVRAPRHQAAWDALGTNHLVLLEGRRGLGKRASAIALLRERTSGPLTVLSPASTTRELAEHEYEEGHGYLVVDQDADGAPHPNFAWHTVRDKVHAARAFLVVTRREPVGDDVEMVTAVPWEPPPLADVVRAHLPGDEENAAGLAAALPRDCTMTEVVKAAARVAAGEPVPAAVRHLRTSVVDVVRAWFDAGPSPRALLEVTALAFSTDTPGDALAARVAALAARVPGDGAAAEGLVVTRPSGARAFADPRYRDPVLAELSARHPRSYWDELAAWLVEIVAAGADLSVAFGLAGLAKADRRTVEDTYLEPWSSGRLGWSGQTTAAFTVWAMCLDEDSVSTALRIVRGWVRGTPAQRQTAALALSGELGVRFPAEAVAELRGLLAAEPDASGALGTLFGTLSAEGEDGTVVLAPLAVLLDDVTTGSAPAHERDAVKRSVLSALSATNATDGEPALSSFLRGRPDRGDLVSDLLAPLLTDEEYVTDTFAAMTDVFADLKPEEIRAVGPAIGHRARHPAPMRARTGPVPPRLLDDEPDEGARPYPIVARHGTERRRRVRGLPSREPHEVLVFHVDGHHVADPGRGRRFRLLSKASHVSVVDVTARRTVRVAVALRGAAAEPFVAVVRFACTVVDPVLVARAGVADAERRLHDHLCAHRRLLVAARAHRPRDVDVVRECVAARVRAYLDVRPVDWPGLTAELTHVDVLAPPEEDDDVH